MPQQSVEMKIAELNQRLSVLRQNRAKLRKEVEISIKERNRLNERLKRLQAEILEFKTGRNMINAEVKELKRKRTELKTQISEKIEEAKSLGEGLKILGKKEPEKSISAIQNEIEAVEWKIQTSSFDLKEERMLVEKVKNLEAQLAILKRLKQKKRKLRELRRKIAALEKEEETCHKLLLEKAEKSQTIHRHMVSKIEELKKIKAEAEALYQQFMATKEKIAPLNSEIQRLVNQLKTLQSQLMEAKIEEKKKSEEILREKLKQKALEKLRQGEKLTWAEFQLIGDENL